MDSSKLSISEREAQLSIDNRKRFHLFLLSYLCFFIPTGRISTIAFTCHRYCIGVLNSWLWWNVTFHRLQIVFTLYCKSFFNSCRSQYLWLLESLPVAAGAISNECRSQYERVPTPFLRVPTHWRKDLSLSEKKIALLKIKVPSFDFKSLVLTFQKTLLLICDF